ncbi:MAG: hypothetical protein M3Y41_17340 [Pseudomonadota bacterium]|nr:hypothetical protein [Pseudomonadota bacterium]
MPGAVTIGSGPDGLQLLMAEDPWQGDAEFTVAVDGQQVGGPGITTAVRWQGQDQLFNIRGNWAPRQHTVTVTYLNDAAALKGQGRAGHRWRGPKPLHRRHFLSRHLGHVAARHAVGACLGRLAVVVVQGDRRLGQRSDHRCLAGLRYG